MIQHLPKDIKNVGLHLSKMIDAQPRFTSVKDTTSKIATTSLKDANMYNGLTSFMKDTNPFYAITSADK